MDFWMHHPQTPRWPLMVEIPETGTRHTAGKGADPQGLGSVLAWAPGCLVSFNSETSVSLGSLANVMLDHPGPRHRPGSVVSVLHAHLLQQTFPRLLPPQKQHLVFPGVILLITGASILQMTNHSLNVRAAQHVSG